MICVFAAITIGPGSARAFEPIVEYDWGSVRCLSEFTLSDAEVVRDELQTLRRELADTLRLSLDSEPIEIRLCATRRRYLEEVAVYSADGRRQRGLYVVRDGRACIFSFQQRELAPTLRHEATHAWLHSALPYVPLWLDEGLATCFELAHAEEQERGCVDRLRWSLKLGWRPDLSKLEQIRSSGEMDGADYRHAWGWVHFLLHDSDQSRAVLTDYLREIAVGEPPRPFSAVLSERLPAAREQCALYLEDWDPEEARIAAPLRPPAPRH